MFFCSYFVLLVVVVTCFCFVLFIVVVLRIVLLTFNNVAFNFCFFFSNLYVLIVLLCFSN